MSKNVEQISRVTRSKEQAKISYNRMSRIYDLMAGSTEKKYADIGFQKLGVKEGERVLEIGPGTGHFILAFAKAVGDSGKVYGIDISDSMCKITRSRIRKAKLIERVQIVCGDAAGLPFVTHSFDAVFISFTLELFDTPEIPAVLLECQRVLRTGGRISVVAMAKEEKASSMTKLYEWAHRRLPSYVDCRPIFVQEMVADAGFKIIDVSKTSMWGLPVEIVLGKSV